MGHSRGGRLSQDMGAVNLEADGLLRDALVVAHSALRLVQDLLPDSVKVIEALACVMTEKLCVTETSCIVEPRLKAGEIIISASALYRRAHVC